MAHPSELIPPAPPNASLRLGQQPKKGGKNKKSWLQEQCVRRQKCRGNPGEVEHYCKHCETVLSGTNVTRLKTHLLNGNACKKFLQSPVAAELTKVVKEVEAALLVYTPKASSSKRSLTSSYRMFQVRSGTYKAKVV